MADEKKESLTAPSKDDKQAIKKLELEMKTAFKDGKFDDVRKKAEELKKLDPQSHIADRLIEKAEKAEKDEKKKQNAGKIKELEAKLSVAFGQGDVPKVSDLLDEIREMDPDNKKATKIENHILKAKAALDKQVMKGKIKALIEETKPLLKDQKWDEVAEKANEILKLEWNQSFAVKALKQAAKAKKTDVAKLITVEEPPKADRKPGFFAKLFKKKDKKAEAPAAKADAKTEKPVEPVPTKAEGSKTEGKDEKPAEAKPALSKAEEKPKEAAKKVEAKAEVKKAEKHVEPVPTKAEGSKAEGKPGMFAKLFRKKEKTGEKPQEAKAEEKKPEEKKGLFGMLKKKAETEEKKAPAPKTAAEKEAPKAQAAKPLAAPLPAAPKPAIPAKPAIAGGGTAAKPTSGVKPIAIAPLAPAAPAKPAIAGEGTAAKPAPAPAKPATPAAKPAAEGEKGNIFTSLFGKKESAAADEKKGKSIIDTIVEKSDKVPDLKKVPKKKVESTGEGFLKFSGAFLQFSIVFILISAGFFYVQNIDEENRVLALAGIEQNNASQLRSAANTLEKKRDEKNGLNKEIKRFQEGYVDDNIETIQTIIDARMDWPDIIAKLNEVTESVYEKNALLQYIQYSNYSYDVETGQLSTSATLSDPQGRNLTKLAEIEIAFRNYPRDPDNPDDDRKPYFYGFQEMNSFAKSFNKSTGRYLSTFSVNISTKEQKK